MIPQKPFPPRTLAEALDYYAGADYNNAINTAKKDSVKEVAKKMKTDGVSAELIAKYTSLSVDEIENL